MANQKLVSYFLVNQSSLSKSTGKLKRMASMKGFSKESIQEAKDKARNILNGQQQAEVSNYVGQLEAEIERKVNNEKGTLESKTTCDFEPKTDLELAELHKIDLEKYNIRNYWSKLLASGQFTSSVFAVQKKLGDSVSKDELINAVKEALSGIKPKALPKPKVLSENKALFLFFADEHVGAAVTDGLYENDWNAAAYYKRKSTVIDLIKEQVYSQGKFDKLVMCSLGDNLDGFGEETTRGGHHIPQNMTNKQAIKTYLEINKLIWEDIIELNPANTYEKYDIENSNHGGLGWDAAANLALDTFLNVKYPFIKVKGMEDFIDSFSYGIHDFHLCHGKDEKYMKRNLPLYLNPTTENFIKEYLDDRGFKDQERPQHFLKGDLHKFNTEQGKFFTYNNIPSLFGGSAWIGVNFGKSMPGYGFAVVPEHSKNFNIIPYWI